MGTKRLTKVQYGKETTHGVNVASDTMLLCAITLPESDREIHIPQVDAGNRTPGLLSVADVRKVLAEGTLEDMDGAYYELFPVMLAACLESGPSGIEQTGGEGDYLWTFSAPQTAAETIDSLTLEAGETTTGYEIGYVMFRSLNFTGDCETGEVHISGEWFGEQQDQTTVTPALSLPTAELANAKLTQIYIDSSWAGLGGSELVNSLVNFDITINGGGHPKHLGTASRLFSSHGQGEITGEATFTFERNAAIYAEEAFYRPSSGYAQTPRFIRIEIIGTQIGSGDTQKLTIDMAGLWTAWPSISDEKEGNTLDVPTLTFGHDATSSEAFQAQVTTTIQTI